MISLLVFVTLISLSESLYIVKPGPKYPPSKGEIWPQPQHELKLQTYYTFDPSEFQFKVPLQTCKILTDALERYVYRLTHDHTISRRMRKRRRYHGKRPKVINDINYLGLIKHLEVALTEPCEDYPYFNMNEAYNLTISNDPKLMSSSIWGILLGLESFSQLFYISKEFNDIRINTTQIEDYPRYSHRGLLLDTGRHFISMKNLLRTLDAMSMSKMNVFHWHIVDDQSFPYQSEKLPLLSAKGAFHSNAIYTKTEVQKVIAYARDRGIRVVPEYDVPGHTASWGVAYPDILTKCYSGNNYIGLGPMDPTKNITYQLIKDLFDEVNVLFPDKYFHLGGDEVDLSCWASNPDLQEYMRIHNLSSINELHTLFMNVSVKLVNKQKDIIVWQEVFEEKVPLSPDTLIQVWKSNPIPTMINAVDSGHRVIFSSSWYLDQRNNLGTWQEMYESDPRIMIQNTTLAESIVGGEACMWGEMVDNSNVISRVWPRACAVAERLWTNEVGIPLAAVHRIEEQTCRLIRRGINAQPPNGPSYCLS